MFEEKFTTKEIQNKRYSICRNCDSNNFGVCVQCGCILKLKIRLKDAMCPIGNWGKVK